MTGPGRAWLLGCLLAATPACTGELEIPLFGDTADGEPVDAADARDQGSDAAFDSATDRGVDSRLDAASDLDAGAGGDGDAGPDAAAGLPDLVDLDAELADAGADAGDAGDAGDIDAGGGGSEGFVRYTDDRTISPVTTGIIDSLDAIYTRSDAWQDDVFMKVGASGTVSTSFFQCFAGSGVDLAGRDYLDDTIDHFAEGDAGGSDPYTRETLAAVVGRSASWAIGGDPSPLDQEIAAIAPRFALVNYGTNDMQLGATYESALYPFYDNYADLLDQLTDAGIVPLVTGILSRGDSASADLWVETYNAVIRGMAEARQVPFVDLHRGTEAIPDRGLSSDGLHASTYRPGGVPRACDFTAAGLDYGYNVRNLITMEALDRVRAPLLEGAEAPDDDVLDYSGAGSTASPIVIDRLPFTHLGNTATSPYDGLDSYDGCSASQNEAGPELVYRLELASEQRLRFLVLDRGDVDIDVHLLEGAPTTAACIARNHRIIQGRLAAGTYYVVLDTFVNSGGTELSGEYLFVVTPCAASDSACDSTL